MFASLYLGTTALALAAEQPASSMHAVIEALEFRAIGPAMMGGRIADIEVDPTNRATWYVAAGSGGVWKTDNAGITWTPLFDRQASYSIGEITLDPGNPNVVWVGTGENVSGRHVGWGDGIYRSRDGGASWEHRGLARSEHIGRILVDPRNPDHLLVAVEGPLWSGGGERGVYRSTDGGENWSAVLAVDADTGATDLEFHPEDPQIVYAATYQRRRSVWSFLAGGPGSGIWKSTDGGASWREVTRGLPTSDADLEVGKIGLAVTPAAPDRVYATIEANDGEQGFYVSDDRGESWEKRNDYISGGTGPHYYQEIEASPSDPDRVYQMDVFLHITANGGHDFSVLGTGREKHSDNHALWIDPEQPAHLIAGTDGGLYESFDDGRHWRHFGNLPISQFYKVAVSDHLPFYNILGGAQDLGTLHGPARTLTTEGVRNQDWTVPYGADGYGVAFDPFDPDLFYQMSQGGNLIRHHAPSGENIAIRPQPAPGEGPERWNWDSPLHLSPHQEGRLYFASQRLWRSDDRGNSWRAVSGDLTRGENRFELPVAGRVRSTETLWDLGAMSGYATLSAIAESPLDGGQLWTGSDDGRVHYSADGGETWAEVTPPSLPERAFINDIDASHHSAAGAFVIADNHKEGDYRPLLFATSDGGQRWRDIRGDLPDGIIVWAIQQDHKEPGLLFLAAENGLYTTLDGGVHWQRLRAGVPTIAFRDLKIQRRDGDLVAASFGRGIYILDDIGPLRSMAARIREEQPAIADNEATLFPVRDAWWFIPSEPGQARGLPSQGSTAWRAPNPPIGPMFTVYLPEVVESPQAQRRDSEKALAAKGADIPFPGWDALADEASAPQTRYYLQIVNGAGRLVRRLAVEANAGAQRLSWDMRAAAPDPISFEEPGFQPPWIREPEGPLLPPGRYSAALVQNGPDGLKPMGQNRAFTLRAVDNLPGDTDFAAATEFQQAASDALRRLQGVDASLREIEDQLRYVQAAVERSSAIDTALQGSIDAAAGELATLRRELRGNPARGRLDDYREHTIASRIGSAARAMSTRMPPTATQREDLRIGSEALSALAARVDALRSSRMAALYSALAEAGAPWIPGQRTEN